VNERVVDERHVAKRSKLESRQVQAWEYLGVDLEPGDNVLTVVQKDSFGNERGRATVIVIAPGPLANIAIELPRAEPAADGRAEVPIGIALLDERGLPVRARTPVTLDTSMGTWVAPETSLESGVVLMIEGGHATIKLVSPAQPGEARLIAKSGKLREEVRLRFMPDLRQMVAAGVIEGIVNIRRLDSRALVAAGAQDSFERDLTRLSRSSSDGRLEAGARAAFFLKGKILGEALLTAAYDSDKDTQQRLFRDIQPDEFYPVYGDSATRGYDAQSTAGFTCASTRTSPTSCMATSTRSSRRACAGSRATAARSRAFASITTTGACRQTSSPRATRRCSASMRSPRTAHRGRTRSRRPRAS